jgi:hypothetical protein
MAAQPLPLVDYEGTEAGRKQSPAKNHPREQPSWEQFSVAVVPMRTERKPLPTFIDPQPLIEVTAQPETNVSTPFTRNWSAVLAEIDTLAAGTEDEVRASEYAYSRARSTLESVYRQIRPPENVPQVVPEHSVTTDDLGGIRLAWRHGSRQIRINFGANATLRSYIYFESPLEHHVEDLDAHRLAGRLAWLTER